MARPTDRTEELERRWELASGPEKWDLQLQLAAALQSRDGERAERLCREVVDAGVGDAEFQLDSTLTLVSGLIRRGKLDEASELMDSTQNTPTPPGLLSRRHFVQGRIHRSGGRLDDARAEYEAARRVAQERGDTVNQYVALNAIGETETSRGNAAEALRVLEEALRIADETGPGHRMNVANNLCLALYGAGELRRALELAEERRDHAEASGETLSLARTLNNLAMIYEGLGRIAHARDCLTQALELARKLGHARGTALCLKNLAGLESNLGLRSEAIPRVEEALAAQRAIGLPYDEANCLQVLGQLRLDEGDLEGAQRDLDAAVEIAQKLGLRTIQGQATASMGEIREKRGEFRAARELYQAACDVVEQGRNVPLLTEPVLGVCRCQLAEGNPEAAIATLTQAVATTEAAGLRSMQRDALFILAAALREQGSPREAYQTLRAFHELDRELAEEQSRADVESIRVVGEVTLARRQARLEREKNAELAARNAELARLNREKDELMQLVGHDLRNPLTTIVMSASFMQELAPQATPELIQRRQGEILLATDQMRALVDPLMEVGLIDSGKLALDREPVDLVLLVAQVVDARRPVARRKSIEILFDPSAAEVSAHANGTSCRKVLEQLLSNAVKFSPAGERVAVEVAQRGGRALLHVIDQGPGIPAAEQPRVFDRFARLTPEPTAGEPSTGLGLYIAKRLVAAMDGAIECFSTEGRGSRFVVSLPSS